MELSFNTEQINLIKQQVAPEATDNELKLFLYAAQRYGLDPLRRQIFCIHRSANQNINGQWVTAKKMTIQTSIDGFRILAERSGEYGGQDKPKFFYDKDGNVESAEVTVYRFRGDLRYQAAVVEAYFNEYQQTGKDGKAQGLWAKMPRTMLAKCAEALALRKAFPQQLSGLYTEDEMAQADKAEQPAPAVQQVKEAPKQVAAPIPAPVLPADRGPKKAIPKEKPKMSQADLEKIEQEVAASVIPDSGKWFARIEKCKTRQELIALSMQYETEIKASPALMNLFKDSIKDLK